MSNILRDSILHWKKKLQKTTDEETKLNTIRKLSKVPITVEILQETGIGSVIRQLAKTSGDIGEKASVVLAKWRSAVSASSTQESKLEKNEKYTSAHKNASESYDPPKKYEKFHEHDKHHNRSLDVSLDRKGSKTSHDSLRFHENHKQYKGSSSTAETLKLDKLKNSSSEKETVHSHVDKTKKHKLPMVNAGLSNESFTATNSNLKSYNNGIKDKRQSLSENHRQSTDDSSSNAVKSKEQKNKYSGKNGMSVSVHKSASHKSVKQNTPNDELFSFDFFSNLDSNSKTKHANIKNSSPSKNPEYSKAKSEPKNMSSKVSSVHLFNTKNNVMKSSKSSAESIKYNSYISSDSSSKAKEFSTDTKSPSKNHDHPKKNLVSDINTSKKPKTKSLEESGMSLHTHDSKNISLNNNNEYLKHESLDNPDLSKKKRKRSSSPSNSKSKKSKTDCQKTKTSVGFTSSEGRFEDFLNFNDVAMSKKKSSKTKSVKKVTLTKQEKIDIAPKHSVKDKTIDTKHSKHEDISGKASISKEVDISSTLPEIQPFYRPLPQVNYDFSPKKKLMTNEDAIKFTSSRKEKTAVYSGRRTHFYYAEVPSLFDSCIQVLIDNIDSIEYMGYVPFILLKTMLERCSAAQLFKIEHYNPYLIEDTQDLWEGHCKKDFKCHKLQEDETWRDLYWRAQEEREQKLKSVTANISASMSKSNPVRQVKLAYVDSFVKPPRDVARRQAKNGTASTKVVSTQSVIAQKRSKTEAASTSTPVPRKPVIAPAPFVPKKPKVAPLMAKTLKSMKQCFRR